MDEASAEDGRTRKTYAARLMLVLCSLAACVCPLTAFAQSSQQTPTSAQLFLATTLPKQYTVIFKDTGFGSVRDESATVSDIKSSSACYTTWYRSNKLNPNARMDDGINWRGVVEVRQERTFVYITSEIYTKVYDFRSESLAARAAFAMEFLRLHCDPTAGTGF